LIYAHLREDGAGRIGRSSLYLDLDRSEKTSVSYYLGMTMTKIAVSRLLGVPWLMHVDRYAHQWGVTFGGGRTRPDLIGPNSRWQWIVAEGKGRTGGRDGEALQKMAQQKRAVRTIAGRPPLVSLGCLSYFNGGRLALAIVDPDDEDMEPIDYTVDRDLFIVAYYRPITALLEQFPSADAELTGQQSVALPEVDAVIGLDTNLYQLVTEAAASPSGLAVAVADYLARRPSTGDLQNDGVSVSLGTAWSPPLTQRGFAE
jgi:hypothetical protein